MKKIKISLVLFAMIGSISVSLAANNNIFRDELEDFYVDNSGNRINIAYPSLGICTTSTIEFCHALYSRPSASAPWVLTGTIQKGKKPF